LRCTSHARYIALKQRHVYNESSVCMLAMLLCNLCNSLALGLFFAVKHLCALLLKQLHQSGVTVASCTSQCVFLHHKDMTTTMTTMATTTTFRKLAAPAAELIPYECQVESFTAELHDAHEAAMSHSTQVLHLQSVLNAHDATQTDPVWNEAKEASWSMPCAQLMRQVDHTHRLEAAHACDG
jgi:hypothetical protein